MTVRIIASYVMASFCGNMVIAYAEMLSWICLLIMYLLRFVQSFMRKKKMGERSMVCR